MKLKHLFWISFPTGILIAFLRYYPKETLVISFVSYVFYEAIILLSFISNILVENSHDTYPKYSLITIIVRLIIRVVKWINKTLDKIDQ